MLIRIRQFIPGLAVLALLHLLSTSASTCTCGQIRPCEAYAGADTVFVGTALSIISKAITDDVPANAVSTTLTSGGSVTRFRVEEGFRGTDATEIEVSGNGTTCDYGFKLGRRYLVFAQRGKEGKYLYTSICSGTSPVSEAKEILRYLRAEQKMATGGTFQGRVSRIFFNTTKNWWDLKPLPNVEIVLESGQSRFQTVSDKQGRFELSGLPGGRYKIRPNSNVNFSSIESSATAPQAEWERIIPDHGCVTESFETKPSGEIAGQVLGTPPDDMSVEIIFADRTNTTSNGLSSAKIDKEGRFKFSFLPPGKYFIGINMESGPYLDDPYPEYYYPNVTERQKAMGISLGENGKLYGIELPLPSSLPERTIEGTAVWPDGRPAVGVSIELHNSRSGYRDGNGVWTDYQGHFVITGIEGQTYRLSALVEKGTSLVNSKPIIIKLEEKNKPVRLVINLP